MSSGEWERHWNADHDAYYYHNPATNETVWTEPESWHDAAPEVQQEQEQEEVDEYAPEEDSAPAEDHTEQQQQLEETLEAVDEDAAYREAEPAAAEGEWDAEEQAEAALAYAVDEPADAADQLAAMEESSEEEEEEDDEAAALLRAGLACAWRTVPDNKGGFFYLNQLTDQTTYDEPEAHRVWRLSQEGASDARSSSVGTPLKRRASLPRSAEAVSSVAAEQQPLAQAQQRDIDAMEVDEASPAVAAERKSADRATARAKAAKAAAAAAEADDDAYFAAARILPPPGAIATAAAAAAPVAAKAKAKAKAVSAAAAAAAVIEPETKVPKTAADFAAVMRSLEEELQQPDAVMETRVYAKLKEYTTAAGAQATAAAAEAAAAAAAAAAEHSGDEDSSDSPQRPTAAAIKRAIAEAGKRAISKSGAAGLQLLVNNYRGYAQYAVLAGQWLQATNSGDAPAAATATSAATSAAVAAALASAEDVDLEDFMLAQLEKALFAAFDSGRADTLQDIPRWLGELQESPRWRKVLVRLFDAHRDSALLRYVLKQLSDRGHHAEIAVTVSVADIFHVFNGVLQDCLGQVSVIIKR
jgi:TH1 protein